MKRRRISYSRKRKYDEMVTGIVKRQLIYNLEVIDRENAKYHVFLYF
jgi:hypothetical protein